MACPTVRGSGWPVMAVVVALAAATACTTSPAPRNRTAAAPALRNRTADTPALRNRTAATPALLGTTAGTSTSREDLLRIIAAARETLRTSPQDSAAAVRLADASLRQARVSGNAGLVNAAELALRRIAVHDPADYGACRMLAAVHLSQHRFADARTEGARCLQLHRGDAWLMGVVGDAHLELGEYDQAFDAFDAMLARRPTASAYARASYAREIQGDLPGALELMQMALSSTPPSDPESMAWHLAQIGGLELQMGRTDDATRSFAHADYVFPGHPLAIEGRARTLAARGDITGALAVMAPHVAAMPTPDGLAFQGDLEHALGRADAADRSYRLAEAAWISDAPEPSKLARFLADRGRRLDDAVRMATEAAAVRKDIFTLDALAWALHQTGRSAEAEPVMDQARRTGSRDRTIRYHAAAIAAANGNRSAARVLVAEALDAAPAFDVVIAPAARALQASLARTQGAAQGAARGAVPGAPRGAAAPAASGAAPRGSAKERR